MANKFYTWDKSDMIESEAVLFVLFEEAEKLIVELADFRGKLNSGDSILQFFVKSDEAESVFERLSAYSHMWLDENLSNGDAVDLSEKIGMLGTKYGEMTSFASVELTSLSEEFLSGLAKEERFSDYNLELLNIARQKKHILSEKEEELLSGLSEILSGFSSVFSMTNNADLKFEDVVVGGEKQPLNHASYSLFLQNPDRSVRKEAYEKYYAEFFQNLNHISATYVGSVKKDCFLAKTRNFDSALSKALFSEEVDKKVYDRLCECVGENTHIIKNYIGLRKKVLGLSDIAFYDMYVPLFEGEELSLEYEDAYSLVKEALSPMGEEYVGLLQTAYENRWIDVFYHEGKRSGAYSMGIYDCHPYVLLNYEKTTHDVFTIAHEMGHALHSHYSCQNQPRAKAGYKIFVAEVASTVNEVLLLRHLIASAKNDGARKFYLSYFIDMARTTIFRQTMFAEFEAIVHEMRENGEVLSKDSFSKVYSELGKKYYGEDICHDNNIAIEWCRIPHFYRAFYVYKYASGLISAISIAYDILEKGEEAVAKYKEFLKSGCSKTPVELLKIAGVDLETSAPFERAMKAVSDSFEELCRLCEK